MHSGMQVATMSTDAFERDPSMPIVTRADPDKTCMNIEYHAQAQHTRLKTLTYYSAQLQAPCVPRTEVND